MTARLQTSSILSTAVRRLLAPAVCLALLATPAVAHADAIFSIDGRGWGHGIGLSQYGSLGYARQGKTYDWILAHYFKSTTLATREQPTVKVDIDAGKAARSAWRISAGSAGATLTVSDYSGGLPSVDVTGGVSVWLMFESGDAVLRRDLVSAGGSHSAGPVLAKFTDSAKVQTSGAAKDSLVRFYGETGPFAERGIAWRGTFQFKPESTSSSVAHAINSVPMEQYLRGVVPRESPSSWGTESMGGMEALKAQAVAARSYAYDSALSGAVIYCTTMSQVYAGANCLTDGHVHETSRTDSAVSATANRYVVYGSKVITTYFSSSSGGKTANSKDVWFSGASDDDSPVYYTSVADADGVPENPYYRWSLADITGTDLGKKIRDYDNGSDGKDPLEYSAPSPATITRVTTDPGTSGFVRYVTLKWSNGASYTITGGRFRTLMGMRSTAFTVTLTNPPPVVTRYQQSDTRPLWTGPYASVSSSAASGGSYRRMSAAGSSLTVMFKGTSVTWIGPKSSGSGRSEVSLDGTRVALIDSYASSTRHQVAVWSRTGLAADTTHTLVIKALGTRTKASSGTNVGVDAIDIVGSMLRVPRPPVWKRYEQNVSAAKYSAGWATSSIVGLYGGTHAFSRLTSATVTFTFSGTRVRWFGKRAANYGRAWVSVDGATPVLVDQYSSATLYRQRLFESALLQPGSHTLKIRVAGTKNSSSNGRYVDADAFQVLEPAK